MTTQEFSFLPKDKNPAKEYYLLCQMNEFILYILRFGSLNQHQTDFVLSKAKEMELRKDTYFWEAGKMPKLIGFIAEGIIRVCFYDNKGEEITRYFIDENHLIIEWENFEATFYLQAVTDCKLIVFTKSDWKEISDTILNWDKIIQKVTAKFHIEKLERRSPLIEQDATTRYIDFMEKFPTLVNRIPLSFIASYLGITQQSLSRIRKSIS